MLLHRCHDRKGLSKGYMSGGMFFMGSVFAIFCSGWYQCNCSFLCESCVCVDWSLIKYETN